MERIDLSRFWTMYALPPAAVKTIAFTQFDMGFFLLEYAQFLMVSMMAVACRLFAAEDVKASSIVRGMIVGLSIGYLSLLYLSETETSEAKTMIAVFLVTFAADDVVIILYRAGQHFRENWRDGLNMIREWLSRK